ncbi:unnamed protein product [Didymodactylos carnosus]|uniref:3CxxC-type domain-containing protein n=1 Tax=Didymodactylos carnosus TaxID=1234261 RepID=A0A8S2F9T4_9BILA|nr:unnamed protein product [Didymodactylos carnosus]CAF4203449.1 unnamed protein product [Didymodactylos carnosus]
MSFIDWNDAFNNSKFNDLSHNWSFDLMPKNINGLSKENRRYVQQKYAHFTCTRCSNGWSSAKATVEFYHRLDCGRGTIRMLLLGQQCKKCGNRNGTYSEPDFPSDVMEKILDNLHRCICEKYYGQPRVKNRNPENAKKMNGPHIRELCEACRKGICKEDRA